jgi:hypothetical protein
VLLLDPQNQAAAQGIHNIADQYGRLADGALARFQYEKAETFVASGLDVSPEHPYLLALKDRLSRDRAGVFFDDVKRRIKKILP